MTVWRCSNLDIRHASIKADVLWHDVGKFTRAATRFNQSHNKQSAFAVQAVKNVRRKDALSYPIHVKGFYALKFCLCKTHIAKRVLALFFSNMLKVFAVELSQTPKVFIARAAAHGLAAISGVNPVLPKLAHRMGMVARYLSHIEVAIDFDKVGHSAAFDF